MEKHYLIIWKRLSYNGIKRTPLTIIVNESDDAEYLYQRIITKLADDNYIKEHEVKIKGIYKL